MRAGGSWVAEDGSGSVIEITRNTCKPRSRLWASATTRAPSRRELKTVAPEDGHMDENVGLAAVQDDEAIALGGVEPFDPPGDFDEPNRAFIAFCDHAPSLPTVL